MSDGIASLYIICTETELFLSVEKIFLQRGIKLADPNDGFVKMLDENYDIGNFSRDDLLANLSQSDQVSFQWWWGESEDLYCRIRKAGQFSIIEFGIEHTSKEQTEEILRTFIEILHHRRDNYVRFVVDRSGYLNTNNYDIDELVVHSTTDILDLSIILEINLKDALNQGYDIQLIAEHIMDSLIIGNQSETTESIAILG